MKICDAFTEGEGLNWDLFGADPDPNILPRYVEMYYVSIRPIMLHSSEFYPHSSVYL